MNYLYERVSTDKQDTDNQSLQLLAQYPDGVIVSETASGLKVRPELDRLGASLCSGDTLVVVAIDRLGRSTIDILSRIRLLLDRGVRIHSLREGMLDQTPSGKFLVTVLAAAAELERNLIAQRTKAGMDRVRREGSKSGRPIGKPALGQEPQVLALVQQGYSQRSIARQLGVSVGYVNKHAR